MLHPHRFALCLPLVLAGFPGLETELIRRDDVDESAYVELAKQYPATGLLTVPLDAMGAKSDSTAAGTLIHPQWVLTAVHNLLFLDAAKVDRIRFEIGGKTYRVDRFVGYPSSIFISDMQGVKVPSIDQGTDIALCHLTEAVPDIMPAAIYRGADELGQTVAMVGNGGLGTFSAGTPNAQINRVMNPLYLQAMRAGTNRIDAIGGSNQGTTVLTTVVDAPGGTGCNVLGGPAQPTEFECGLTSGDSGGSLYLADERGKPQVIDGRPVLVGIVSGVDKPVAQGFKPGAANGPENRAGVVNRFTRVSSFAAWIEQVIASPSDKPSAPVITAMPQRQLWLHQGAAATVLAPALFDDGFPGTAHLSCTWTMVSGPAPVDFRIPGFAIPDSGRTAPMTEARFAAAGTYQVRVTVDDGGGESSQALIDVQVHDASTPGPSLELSATAGKKQEKSAPAHKASKKSAKPAVKTAEKRQVVSSEAGVQVVEQIPIPAGIASQPRSLTLANRGGDAVSVQRIDVRRASNCAPRIEGAFPLSIAAGATVTLPVVVVHGEGPWSCELEVTSNDPASAKRLMTMTSTAP